MVLVYHYTTEAGLDAIYQTNVVKASSGGAFGPGVYFTEMDPSQPKDKILANNWGGGTPDRIRFWYKFKTEDYPAIRQVSAGGRNIWLHAGDMKLHVNSRVKIYHYTDLAGKDAILSCGRIQPHQPPAVTRKDGTVQVLPKGVFFTELRPRHSMDRKKRMLRVFGSSARDEALYRKTKYWFWFRVGDLPGVRKQRAGHGGYEWVLEGEANIRLGRT